MLTLTFSSTWALQLWAQVDQQSSRMACCKRGKVHACCKRTKKPEGPAFTAARACQNRCATDFASPWSPLAAGRAPANHRLAAARPQVADAVTVSAPRVNPGYLSYLHQRPPPYDLS